MGSPYFGFTIFNKICHHLASLKATFTLKSPNPIDTGDVDKAVSCLKILKCSFWLPPEKPHYLAPALFEVLVDLLGREGLDDTVHDTLSSYFSLTKEKSFIILRQNGLGNTDTIHCSSFDASEHQLWTRLRLLPSTYFTSSSSKIFRTWFQWISNTEIAGATINDTHDPLYWSRLQAGLLSGFGEQRKYCLGILRTSILVTRRNINTPLMTFDYDRRVAYQQQYEKYCTLFEIIVLDRYQNQIRACLPELTVLLSPNSLVSVGWQTALLSAAMTSQIQDTTRKLIGTWYINHIIKEPGSVAGHESFLIDGLLPWATQGTLFTSSLVFTRQSTTCIHGINIVNFLVAFITSLPTQDSRQLFANILSFILDKGGRIFQHTIIYVLEGLFKGFQKCASFKELELNELNLLLRVSRLTGLPEIASDLCATYCAKICEAAGATSLMNLTGHDVLRAKFEDLQTHSAYGSGGMRQQRVSELTSLQQFLNVLRQTQHKLIQDDSFVSACENIKSILDKGDLEISSELSSVLEALWDEAERQDFRRLVAVQLPPLFFHLTCVRVCVEMNHTPLVSLLINVLQQLSKLAQRRTYLASVLTTSLRRACITVPRLITILPLEDFLLDFISNPPVEKIEFLFEVAAAEKLQTYLPHRDYYSYYGKREWYAFATIIDLLNHLPKSYIHISENLMRRILEPWANQKPPISVISRWKSSFQLQVMLILTESCITPSNAEKYLESFKSALMVDSWPRYRYLLEWIIVRIYYRCPDLAPRMLDTLANLDEGSPVQIASLIKLAVLVAPFLNSKDFALNLMTQLVHFSAHHKVQIRHEAHWSVPLVWNLATERHWEVITSNPAFKSLNSFVTNLERFNLPPSSIRTLKLDAVADYTITNIFQGQYLSLETPERELFARSDILELWTEDHTTNLTLPAHYVPLGEPRHNPDIPTPEYVPQATDIGIAPTTFQTKSGFDLDVLVSASGPTSTRHKRPASVILIASLIDNPTNLGGLSRISESFGLEALYIHDPKHVAHKDFKATSVKSEKHLQIHELKIADVPNRLIEWKREGWTIVGVEQTDRSGILGSELEVNSSDAGTGDRMKGKGSDGTLPRKCVLVLGSEKGGITSEVLAVVDRCVEIKTVGATKSLNVQTAGGIVMYEWWREWGGRA